MISRIFFFVFIILMQLLATSHANEKVTLQLRWDHQFQFSGYYVAKWKGYYDAVGLDVDIKSAVTRDQILSAVKEVAEKRAEFGIGAADILKARDEGIPLVVVASIFQNSASAFYTREGTAVDSPVDFTKLKVARRLNDLIDIEFQAILKAEGIDPSRVRPYPHQPGIDHLISGEVDVVPGYSINIPFTAQNKDFSVRELRPIQYGIDFYGDSLFAHEDLIRKKPEIVNRFKEASIKGWQYALENKEETIDYIVNNLTRVKTVDDLRKFNTFQSNGISKITHYPVIEIGHTNPDRWEKMHNTLKSIGVATGEIDIDNFIYNPEKEAELKAEKLSNIFKYSALAVAVSLVVTCAWIQMLRRTVKAKTKEYREINAKLKESEEYAQDILKAAENIAFIITDLGGKNTKILDANPGAERIFGYRKEELIGQEIAALHLPGTRDEFPAMQQRLRDVGAGYSGDTLLVRKSGEHFHAHFTLYPRFNKDNQLVGTIGVSIDISEKKTVEIELKKSQERFELAMEAAQDGLYDWNLLTNEIYYSPAWKRMLGYKDHELANNLSVWEQLTQPQDLEKAREMQNELIRRERDRFEMEFKMKHKNGQWVDILSRAIAIFNDQGEAIRIVGTHLDITRQKQLLKDLEELSKDQSAILDNVPAYIYFKDKENNIIKISQLVSTATGLPKDEIEGHHSSEIYPETAEQYWKDDVKIIDSGKPKLGIIEPLPVESGGTRWLLTNKVPYFDENEKVAGIIVFSIDITDRKKAEDDKLTLERELSHAQRMESIGTLAGGIAHEFNNILSIIIGNNELIMDELPSRSFTRDCSEEIRLAGLRARDIVKQLLTFSRQDSSKQMPIDISSVVSESLKLIRATTPTNIKIRDNISPNCLPIFGNVTQINQVLINLCNNAVDALPISNGIVEVELFNTEVHNDSTMLPPGKYVKLVIRDNGYGIDEQDLDRVFEPYFTTKDIGKGTGIGLAVVHGIIESHHGTIACESVKNSGTTFSIMLPAYDGSLEEESEKRALPRGAGEHILYVDDEASIARLGERHLKSLGYKATSITDPIRALKLIQENPNRFDLVISDMAMPQMPGDQLISQLLSIRPDLPTIICTGYSSRMSDTEALKIGVKAFLMKPHSKSELADKVREALYDVNIEDGCTDSNYDV